VANELNPEDLESELRIAYQSGSEAASVSFDVVPSNTAAAEYAKARAAEAVTLIDSTTQAKLKEIIAEAFSDPESTMDSITEDIDAAGIFNPDRASMIARTEIARAQMQGTISVWQEAGVEVVDVLLGVDACELCQDIAANGPYKLEDIADDYPFHPNCNCSLVVVSFS